MRLVRDGDKILIYEAGPNEKRYLASTGFIFSPSARCWVIPEWAFEGLPPTFHRIPIGGTAKIPAPVPNFFYLSHLPDHFNLYEFQKTLALNLTSGPWGLWADAGCGKTACSLAAYRILKRQSKVKGMIVIGPENGRHVWCGPNSDSARFIGEPGFYLESGGEKKPPAEGIIYTTAAKVFLAPYQTWLTELLQTRQFILCIDEVHTCSGALSKRYAQIRSWAKWAQYRWLLSATPTSNYPDSFWALYCILTDSNVALDTWIKWFRKGKTEGSKSQWHRARLEGLGRYLKYCTSVVRKDDVAPWLPAVTQSVMRIPLIGKQRELYSKLVDGAKAEGAVGSQVEAGRNNWRHHLSYLVSMASHPLISGDATWKPEDIGKLDALKMILDSAGDQKVCIWSWHPNVLNWIAEQIGPEQCVIYHGQVSESQKTAAVHRFNEDPNVKYFLGNPQAAGTSLNLGAGTMRVFWDLGWSYVQFHQACERINRITRTKPITSYVLIAENTIEEVMWNSIQRKEELAGYITSESNNRKQDQVKSEVLNLWSGS